MPLLPFMLAFLTGVGALLASGSVFRHQRVLTFLATAGALAELHWLFLTLLHRTLAPYASAPIFFSTGLVIILIIWATQYKSWSSPYWSSPGSGRRDIVVLAVLVPVLAAAWLILGTNSFQPDHSLITHGFYNGDTATFAALVERSMHTVGLVHTNPFAGNGSLEYPTLLHAALATLLTLFGFSSEWLHLLPIMTLGQIIRTIPLFFLLWDVFSPEPAERWQKWFGVPARWAILILQGLIVLYVLTLSWDMYVYPQSHFFLTAILLLEGAFLQRSLREKTTQQWFLLGTGVIAAIVLLFSNAVMGTAGVAMLGVFSLIRTHDRTRRLSERVGYLVGLLALIAIYFVGAAGNASFGVPGFSYTAALDMLRLAPIVLALVVAIVMQLDREPFLSFASSVLLALSFFVFIFSTRDIIIDNASRFFYYGLLIGFPLLLRPLIQAYYWLRRELQFTTHSHPELAAGWLAVLIAAGMMALPGGASVLSAHDNLMFKDEQKVSLGLREALWWIEDKTAPDAVFIASPNEPFSIPMFTGRALLRTDYWLSPDDVILNDIKEAFNGNAAAREKILTQADYLVLTSTERLAWEPLPLKKVFDNREVVIYQVK